MCASAALRLRPDCAQESDVFATARVDNYNYYDDDTVIMCTYIIYIRLPAKLYDNRNSIPFCFMSVRKALWLRKRKEIVLWFRRLAYLQIRNILEGRRRRRVTVKAPSFLLLHICSTMARFTHCSGGRSCPEKRCVQEREEGRENGEWMFAVVVQCMLMILCGQVYLFASSSWFFPFILFYFYIFDGKGCKHINFARDLRAAQRNWLNEKICRENGEQNFVWISRIWAVGGRPGGWEMNEQILSSNRNKNKNKTKWESF